MNSTKLQIDMQGLIHKKEAAQKSGVIVMLGDTAVFQVLTNALTASDLRQQVYANNIANMSTPGYKRQDVSFEGLLSNAMSSAGTAVPHAVPGEKSIPIGTGSTQSTPNWSAMLQVQPQIVTQGGTYVSNNGNNVDVNAEMAALAENQIHYNGLVQDLTMRLQRFQTAINGV
ncbi:flagellar basal body rod protein FlgB [Alicyclobacillus tolerans]|uniref:flagellar basal body rod protein FlgB n=1 Tax=Alicyclobacillus tolerans TaxID=90970 RepID=UPI001F000873|nr:flagellar basal body rod protein FlgB [Alicyclobacillus tolerans]MCF8564748.1 flagellar basal body rod protein FlgB [Alicyclobacillus tolerans]